MTRIFTVLLMLLMAVAAGATNRTFGSGGTHATFTAALTAAASGDTLTQVGASSEALASAYTCSNKAIVVMGMASSSVTVTAYKVAFSGTGAITFNNLNLVAALFINKSALAFTATGCNFRHPGTGTEVAVTGWGIGFDAGMLSMTSCTLDSCTTNTGTTGQFYFFSGTTGVANQTFTSTTFNGCDMTGWAAYSSGKVMFSSCSFTGGSVDNSSHMSFSNSADLDSVSFQSCTFNLDSTTYSDFNFNDVRLIRVNGSTIRYWALSSVSKNCLFYFADATTATRPKTIWFTNNTVTLAKAKPTASGAAMIYALDKDAGPIWHITGNTFNVANATEVDYFVYAPSYGSDCTFSSNTLYATNVGFIANVAADTLEASLGSRWTFDSNTVDHTNWTPTSGASAMFTLAPDSVTFSNNHIVSNGTSHIILHNDDTQIGSVYWRASNKGWGASHARVYGNTFDQLATASIHYGIVDKGRSNKYYNNTFIDRGATGQLSRVYFAVGDSCGFHNNDVTMTDVGTSFVVDDGAWAGVQAKGNRVYNNLVRGTVDYVFFRSSGNGSGWAEGNNCWALDYMTRFDIDGDSMATTSFTDSTSWRMDYGGRGGLTGMTDSAEGFQRVGISTTSPGQPAISRTQPGFRTPVEALESVRSIGALKGVTLDMYGPTPQDRANLKLWQFAPHPIGTGTFQSVAGDTLQVRRVFQ